ncbi:hypothetical protein K501DRAFT_273363 [Backusella circina FSU 941]|nr:hypothetical protein K501DRAFT_273363 [Backusella circina FSU 941]
MSSVVTHVQNTPWAPIHLSLGIFTHMNSRYQVNGISVQVISDSKELLKVSQEEIIGVIIAYKKSETQDDSDVVHQTNYLVTSALLDIFQNMGINVMNLDNLSAKKNGEDSRTVRSPSLDEAPKGRGSQGSDKESSPSQTSDDSHGFMSYICMAGNLYQLHGSKKKLFLIGKVSNHSDEQVRWTKLLVSHLESRVATSHPDFSCVAIMRNPDYRKKLKIRRDSVRDLGKQLESYLTTSESHVLLEMIQELEEQMEEYEDLLIKEHYGIETCSGENTGRSVSEDVNTETQEASPKEAISHPKGDPHEATSNTEQNIKEEDEKDSTKGKLESLRYTNPIELQRHDMVEEKVKTSVKRKHDDGTDESGTDKHISSKKKI